MKLSIHNLSKTYPNGVQALKDINLTIGKGMFGLLGQNGAGKSSLMRTLATLQDADSGQIFLGDTDVMKAPETIRRTLGYLPQEFGVYDTVSAEEMLDYVAQIKGLVKRSERRAQVSYLLNRVNLFDVRKKRLKTYSGGMKQRFGIAQALIADPQLIIVDEPTAGLDPEERNRFYNILSELGEEAIVILSTHIVEDVTSLCSDMAIIGGGQVLVHAPPREIAQAVKGKIWTREIDRKDLDLCREKLAVIATHINQGRMRIHHAYISESDYGPMAHARLTPGMENSGKLVTLVRQNATQIAEKHHKELVLIDGSPGIGCPVIASIANVDASVVVVEPTLSGIHDLKRALELLHHFEVTPYVVVNKCDINMDNTQLIDDYCKENSIDNLGHIPFDLEVTKAMVAGNPIIIHRPDSKSTLAIKNIWEKLISSLVI